MDKSKDPLVVALAAELEHAQLDAKLTDVALARATGIDVQSLRRYLKGEREMRSTQFLIITEALNVSADDIADAAKKRLAE
jgi:transcriptional regulator with XRE-family HTH domain